MVKLEHEADVAVAERHARLVAHLIDARLADADLAGIERVEAAEHVQQRALADAGRPDNGQHLAGLDGEIEPAQHVDPRARRLVRLDEAGDLDERHGYSCRSASAGSSLPACRAG